MPCGGESWVKKLASEEAPSSAKKSTLWFFSLNMW
jgi:hypothetical protein